MHGVNRDEHGRVTERRCGDPAHRGLRVAVVMHVGIVEHDLTSAAQTAAAVRFAFHEAVHHPPVKILGSGTIGQVQARIPDGGVDCLDVEGIAHDGVADPEPPARTGAVAHEDDLRGVELDARRAGGDGRIQPEIPADVLCLDVGDLAEGDGDTERGGAVGHAHRFVDFTDRLLAAPLRSRNRIDGQQRRLGLHVVHVGSIVDTGIRHGGPHTCRHLLDHRRTSDILGQDLRAHRNADRKPGLCRRTGCLITGKDGGVRRDHPVATTRPHHRHLADPLRPAMAFIEQHAAESLIGENTREIIHPAVTLRLADHGNDVIGSQLLCVDAIGEA